LRLHSLDPGYDGMGMATWSLKEWNEGPSSAERALRVLMNSETLIPPKKGMVTRLTYIGDALSKRVRSGDHVVIEYPAYAGQYKRGRPKAQSTLNKLYAAIGAAVASCAGVGADVELVKASRARKAERIDTLRLVAKASGMALPLGPRGGKREDEWDAIWLGFWALTTKRYGGQAGSHS
jgi:hypothetical protein